MKPALLILGSTLALVGAVGLVGWTRPFQSDDPGPSPKITRPGAGTTPGEPGPETLALVLGESFGKDTLVSRWVTDSRGTLEVVELRTRRLGTESDNPWFDRARAEREEAMVEHPPLPMETPPTLPAEATQDEDCVALRVDWREALGVSHTLLLHDCFVLNVDDWAVTTENTVRLAQYLFRPEDPR